MALKSKRRSGLDWGLLLAILLPLFAVMPLLSYAGLPNTADGPVHLMRQVELNQAWQQGNFYPRWGTDLALGHGMPIFSYAPPALYQLTQLFHLFGLPLDEAMKAVLVGTFILYSVGTFLFVRRIFGVYPALLAAAVYVYAPYRLREAFIQGNYGQFLGLACYPLIFWAFHGLITDGRPRYWLATAFSLAGLLFSHNISSMLFAPFLAVYLIFLLLLTAMRRTKSSPQMFSYLWKLSARTVGGGLLGLGLAAIFWLPAFGERHDIKLEGITQSFFDFRENFIHVSEFISHPLPLDLASINPEFPLSLGLPQIIGAGLGLLGLVIGLMRWQLRSQTSPKDEMLAHILPHALFFAGFLFFYSFMAVPQSRLIWESVPLVELTEFPWRMLGPAIFCAAVLSGTALALLRPRVSERKILLTLCAGFFVVIALNAYYLYPSQFISWGTPTPAHAFAYEATSGAIGTTSTGEFLPRAAQEHPQPETLWPDYRAGQAPQKLDPASLPSGATVSTVEHLAELDRLHIQTPEPFVATLRTLYWPGWQVYLDGEKVPFQVTKKTGLIQADIPAGEHFLILRLESTPLRRMGFWLSVISVIVLAGIGVFAFRKSDKQVEPTYGTESAAPLNDFQPRFFAVVAIGLIGFYFLSRPLAPWFVSQSDPDRPLPADQVFHGVDFADQLRLVGAEDLPQTVPAGSEWEPTLYWRALQDLKINYSVFIHLDAPNGQTFATVDEVDPEYIPTRNWPPTLYLRHPLHMKIPPDLPPIRYSVMVGVYQRETGDRLVLAGKEQTVYSIGSLWVTEPPPPLPETPLAYFGSNIILWRASFTGEDLELIWQTQAPIEENYNIFVHLLDKTDALLGQSDGVPYEGLYPVSHWLPEQVITDRRPMGSLVQQTDQLHSIAIGLYHPATGERLSARDTAGNPLPHNSFIIPVAP